MAFLNHPGEGFLVALLAGLGHQQIKIVVHLIPH
jgi:hypothetical protein